MIEIVQNEVGSLGGALIAAVFVLGALLSKFRVLWNRDSNEAAVAAAQTAIVEMQRQENTRLHEQVLSLQQEVAKLQVLVAELTNKLTNYEFRYEQQKQIDEMARLGKVERRKIKEG